MNTSLMAFVSVTMPEIVVGAGLCAVLLGGLFAGSRSRDLTYLLAMATLVLGAWATATTDAGTVSAIPGGAFVLDPVARLLKLFAFALAAVVFVYSRSYLQDRALDAGDFYVLALFALLGVLVLASSGSFLMLYLGLETLSLALYGLVAFERDAARGAEAAMKYFVLGAIASGCLLYGISIVYGVTGHVDFDGVAAAMGSGGEGQTALLLGLCFIVLGIAFKFGAVPFHMWVPDVYEGAPTCVTLFIATVPKLAAFALALRVLLDGLALMQGDWQVILAALAVLSLGIGNVVAIAQTNIRRMLAYSAIGHVGFILLGFVAAGAGGVEAALFYTLAYVIMTAAAFGSILLLCGPGREADAIDDFRGLNRRNPWFAVLMMLVMVSMIGVPPLVGFYAKWWVLSALLDAGHLWLAVVGILFSVIGAFYYLRVIRMMYFEDALDGTPFTPALDLRLLVTANVAVVLALGLFPGSLLEFCERVLS
ncbi:MAG: NADH-quinone oxidoreductase subunit NuoN [Gammaproteobacteria bacterium]|nr:NADH-quinone oxidoreductase subunit NuoN [Gammaproteobacteria bacterium]